MRAGQEIEKMARQSAINSNIIEQIKVNSLLWGANHFAPPYYQLRRYLIGVMKKALKKTGVI